MATLWSLFSSCLDTYFIAFTDIFLIKVIVMPFFEVPTFNYNTVYCMTYKVHINYDKDLVYVFRTIKN